MKTPGFQIGTWHSIGSPTIAELAALAGFDWVLFDLEHGCESEAALPNQLRAVRGSTTRGIVRVGALAPDLIARVLDWGADGVMVPHIESADEAQAIVDAAYYAPVGHRGLSRTVRAYDFGLNPPSDKTMPPLIMAQIESVAGIRNVESIANVTGVDVLFVGPADLRHDLQHCGEANTGNYDECLMKVINATSAAEKTAGILLRELEMIEPHIEAGFTHIAVDSDLAIIQRAYHEIVAQNPRCER